MLIMFWGRWRCGAGTDGQCDWTAEIFGIVLGG